MEDTASSALRQARHGDSAMNQTTLARAASKEDIELAEHLISHSRAPQTGGERGNEAGQNGLDTSSEHHSHPYATRETEVAIDGPFDQAQNQSPRSTTAERESFGPQANVLSAGQKCQYVSLASC